MSPPPMLMPIMCDFLKLKIKMSTIFDSKSFFLVDLFTNDLLFLQQVSSSVAIRLADNNLGLQ